MSKAPAPRHGESQNPSFSIEQRRAQNLPLTECSVLIRGINVLIFTGFGVFSRFGLKSKCRFREATSPSSGDLLERLAAASSCRWELESSFCSILIRGVEKMISFQDQPGG
jgi:hypothetical protein